MSEFLVTTQIQELLHQTWFLLLPIAIASWERQRLKKDASGDPKDPDLEIDHIRPLYKGGPDTPENCQALSRPSHAVKHYIAAQQADSVEDKRKEIGAVNMIKGRSSQEEQREIERRIRNVKRD